jgi:hypothetical protein
MMRANLYRIRQSIGFAIAICAIFVSFGALAQASIPDFTQSRFTNWRPDREDGDDFLPPDHGPGPVRSDPEHPYIPNGEGDDAAGNPTYRVADLTNPILTPWSIEQMRVWNQLVLDGGIPFEAQERCYPPGVPAWNIFRRVGGTMTYFVQTPEVVYMIWRGDNQVRRVYLNVPHSENPTPTWHGESVGHYEGNTLVVDTIAIQVHEVNFVDHYRTPHSDQLHVVERFTLIDNKMIRVEINVEDPIAFTMPWNAVQINYVSNTGRVIEESVCAELGLSPGANYFGLQPVDIPTAEVPDF